jgi:hypothetical protein
MGVDDARISGADEEGYGMGAFFLLLNDPDIYGLPPDADVVTRKFESLWVPAVAEAMVLCIAALQRSSGVRHDRGQTKPLGEQKPRERLPLVLKVPHHKGAGLELGDTMVLLRAWARLPGNPRAVRRRERNRPSAASTVGFRTSPQAPNFACDLITAVVYEAFPGV